MNQSEFREKHSELIEYYQYIEMRLKGICAVIPADESRDSSNCTIPLCEYDSSGGGGGIG